MTLESNQEYDNNSPPYLASSCLNSPLILFACSKACVTCRLDVCRAFFDLLSCFICFFSSATLFFSFLMSSWACVAFRYECSGFYKDKYMYILLKLCSLTTYIIKLSRKLTYMLLIYRPDCSKNLYSLCYGLVSLFFIDDCCTVAYHNRSTHWLVLRLDFPT